MNRIFTTVTTIAVLVCIGLGPSLHVCAQEAPDSDTMLMFVGEDLYMVSAASRREESVRVAPAAVTVLGRKELKRYLTLAEALGSVPGFYIEDSGVKEQLFLRGVADSFLVLLDGVPMANDSSNIDYPRGLDLSLDYIKQIEVVRTPGSALWGADAFSGVVNIVTRKGEDIQGTLLKAEAGSFDTHRANCLAGYQKGNLDMLVFASYAKTNGFEADRAESDRPDDQIRELYAKLCIGKQLAISGRYSNYANYYTVNTYDYHNGQDNTPFSFLQATYKDRWWSRVDAELKAYTTCFDNYSKETLSDRIVIPGIGSIPIQLRSRLHQDNWRYGFEAKFDTAWNQKHLLTLGCSYEYDDASSTEFDQRAEILGIEYTDTVPVYPGFENYRAGLYLQDRYVIARNLELTAGLRFDKHEGYRRKISPRASLVWLPNDFADVKLFYGQAYRTPDLYALALDPGSDPEKITSYEGEVTLRLRRGLIVKGNYFFNILDDLLENVTHGKESQSGREVQQGTELSIHAQPLKRLSLYANHTFLFGERQRQNPQTIRINFPPKEGLIPYTKHFAYHLAPDNTLTLGASYTWQGNYTANIEVHYTDAREIVKEFYEAKHSRLPPYWTTDLNLFAKELLNGRLDLALKTRNVFNQHYKYRGTYELLEAAGRSWFLSACWRF